MLNSETAKKMRAKRTEKDEKRKKKGKEAIKGSFFTMFFLVIFIQGDGMCKRLKKSNFELMSPAAVETILQLHKNKCESEIRGHSNNRTRKEGSHSDVLEPKNKYTQTYPALFQNDNSTQTTEISNI